MRKHKKCQGEKNNIEERDSFFEQNMCYARVLLPGNNVKFQEIPMRKTDFERRKKRWLSNLSYDSRMRFPDPLLILFDLIVVAVYDVVCRVTAPCATFVGWHIWMRGARVARISGNQWDSRIRRVTHTVTRDCVINNFERPEIISFQWMQLIIV